MAVRHLSRIRWASVCSTVVTVAVLAACGSSAKTGGPPTTAATTTTTTATPTTNRGPNAATPEDAIRDYLAIHGHAYIGDCSKSRIPADIGKYCSLLRKSNGATRSYLVGPVASEGDVVVVVREGQRWRVASVAPTPPLAP